MKSEGVSHNTFYIRFTKSLEITELCLTLYSNIEHMIFEELKTKMCPCPAGNYMFKVNNGNTRTRCEICSKLKIKTPERRQ